MITLRSGRLVESMRLQAIRSSGTYSKTYAVTLQTSTPLLAGPLLIVSPHMDDAALSCSGLLARDEPIDILTVFAGEPNPPRFGAWDAACGFANSAESARIRRAEEEAAFSGSPHRVRYLTLVAGQYLDGARPAVDAQEIRGAIRAWIDAAENPAVAIPAGAGGSRNRLLARLKLQQKPKAHPDHIYVRQAALQAVLEVPLADAILYEELPYLWGGSGDRAASRAAEAVGRRAVAFELEIDPVAKARRLRAYASQIPQLGSRERRLDDPSSLPPRERYWRLERR